MCLSIHLCTHSDIYRYHLAILLSIHLSFVYDALNGNGAVPFGRSTPWPQPSEADELDASLQAHVTSFHCVWPP
jgi:hypothetical protein